MRRKGPKAPFAPVTLILLFGKKRPAQVADNGIVADSKTESFPVPDILEKTITGNDVSKARDRLRLASLERDIIGDALTKIYEAEAKGQINEPEKNQLLQRYKTDLKRVDGEIDTPKTETTQTPPAAPAAKERPPRDKPKNKAEERLETIREEVLKAMERLEQIETEG